MGQHFLVHLPRRFLEPDWLELWAGPRPLLDALQQCCLLIGWLVPVIKHL